MRDLFIIGGGGFASEVLFVIERIQVNERKWNNIYIVDDFKHSGDKIRNYKVVGSIDYLLGIEEEIDAIITINDPIGRKFVVDKVKSNKNIFFPNIYDASSIVDKDYLHIGEGNVIMHYVVLSTDLTVGDFNIFNSYSGVGHDSVIGDFNSFNPRVAISGRVIIGDLNSFGLCSSVLQNKRIGCRNEIWLHTNIVKNIKDGNVYFGNPAKRVYL